MRSIVLASILASVAMGCDSGEPPRDAALDAPSDAGADVPRGSRCADASALEICDGVACRVEPCRGDELCEGAACVPWAEAALFADFTLSYTSVERGIAVSVLPGGFPRTQLEALRFSFGDGVAGWGELLRHRYDAPGVYAVELEVRLTGHRVLRASKLAVIDPPADHSPLFFTVNEIPAYLNGTIPFVRNGGTRGDPSDDVREPFVLEVPRSGFVLEVTLLDDPEDPIDPSSLSLVADVPMGSTPAGTELADRLRFETGPTLGVSRARWQVAPDEAAPEGTSTFALSARARGGRAFDAALTLSMVTLTPARDPFDRPMTWLFRSDTDFFATERGEGGALVSVEGPNGRPDLVEELALIGAQGPDPSANARYLAWIEEALRADVYRYFGIAPDGTPNDDIALSIVWQGTDGAPDPASFRADGDFSMMRFGGSFDGYVGFSGFAPYNEGRVDDSSAGRGVASATLLGTLRTTPVVSSMFEPIDPVLGAPVGTHSADAEVLDPSFDPWALHDALALERYETLRGIARYIALAIGAVTAHEMGHAMGLMPNGPPPFGFFGDVLDVELIDPAHTDPHHADFPGLNLMQAGGGFATVVEDALAMIELPRGAGVVEIAQILALENRLSPYSRAYLQRRLTYSSFEGAPSGLSVGCR